MTFDATVLAPPAGYANVAEVVAADQFDPDSTPGNDDGDQSEDDEDNAAWCPSAWTLELVKTVSDASPNVGDVVTFTLTVTNARSRRCHRCCGAGRGPGRVLGHSNISAGGTLVGSTITWSGLSVSTATPVTVTFEATVDAPTGGREYLNVAEVTAVDQFDPDSTPGNDDGDQSEDDEDNAPWCPSGPISSW